jgi:biopolymer transport protein ExbB
MQFLASVGANAPFIGLFGTVYGIMNSFIGIANTNTTNLAVVAPGIAQALLATGIGLFAAIPAVIFYNLFQTQITGYGSRSEGFVAELINAVSRQLDKGA